MIEKSECAPASEGPLGGVPEGVEALLGFIGDTGIWFASEYVIISPNPAAEEEHLCVNCWATSFKAVFGQGLETLKKCPTNSFETEV